MGRRDDGVERLDLSGEVAVFPGTQRAGPSPGNTGQVFGNIMRIYWRLELVGFDPPPDVAGFRTGVGLAQPADRTSSSSTAK